MKPAGRTKKYVLLALLMIGPGLALLYISKGDHNFEYLPYLGKRDVEYKQVNGQEVADTVYHQVPSFEMVNQFGDTVSLSDFDDKILVVDFFFTTCPTICPIMTKQMSRLQWKLDDAAYKDVHFLSFSVNPGYDTPQVLHAYAEEHGADLDRWTFLTGEKGEIYDLAVNGLLVPAQEDVSAPGGFLHSEKFILVDREQHIRGMYDGTNTEQVDNLVTDIKMLLKEEMIEAKKNANT